ncbi:Transaldolase [Tetrabaena socialis]|uniref:Transaldolase n=1 Tax=Tetrabaena socialis TaxID=47790 RepID=A0A2J8AH81_9CHLO|nr:Transaldolase [Tetrabaena socialis]|eukprot:PNH11872.1 Transaldolase [Tetrabaena socialis]
MTAAPSASTAITCGSSEEGAMALQTQPSTRRVLRGCDAPQAAARPRSVAVRAYIEEKAPHAAPHKGTSHALAFKNQLEALRSMSVVVADSGELDLVKKYRPQDCTTNPSLVYKALSMPENRHMLERALAADKRSPEHAQPGVTRPYAGVADQLSVDLGSELARIVPGRVSTEVDANLSYASQMAVDKLKQGIEAFAADQAKLEDLLAATAAGQVKHNH